jgi:hypothetical protein
MIATFLKFVISIRGVHSYYSPRSPENLAARLSVIICVAGIRLAFVIFPEASLSGYR